jgi:hypothetical protein
LIDDLARRVETSSLDPGCHILGERVEISAVAFVVEKSSSMSRPKSRAIRIEENLIFRESGIETTIPQIDFCVGKRLGDEGVPRPRPWLGSLHSQECVGVGDECALS